MRPLSRAERRARQRNIAKDLRKRDGCRCRPAIVENSDELGDTLSAIRGARPWDTMHRPDCPFGEAATEALTDGVVLCGLGDRVWPRCGR